MVLPEKESEFRLQKAAEQSTIGAAAEDGLCSMARRQLKALVSRRLEVHQGFRPFWVQTRTHYGPNAF